MVDFGGRYRLVRRLGAGGMGEVWLAHDQELYDRPVAIKRMHSHMLADAEDVARFQRELRLACRMQHPNIMTVFTSGSDNGVPFMVMEYLEGKDLGKTPPGHSPDEVARIGRETCMALAYAHGLEVVHRDIKPANLFVCDTGLVKVTDFGIAKAVGGTKLSATGTLIGTFPYMAPEQWLGKPAAFSNDIWAAGCVLYELLSGRVPRTYETAIEYVTAAARQEPVPDLRAYDVPPWIAEAVMAMLQPDSGQRPTAAQCVRLLSGPPARVSAGPAGPEAAKAARDARGAAFPEPQTLMLAGGRGKRAPQLAVPQLPRVPRLLGDRYELDGLIGRGSTAEVYRARDLRLERTVAVKTLRSELAHFPAFRAQFRREAQSATSLNSPFIVAVHGDDEDMTSGAPVTFIVTEYVNGRTVQDLLAEGRLLPGRAVEIVSGVLRALEYAHQVGYARTGLVHRNIKPGNVMVTLNGDIKVMNFGVVHMAAQYPSPEQARGRDVDTRSDLYSTGCLMYELLTGRPPFAGDSPVALAHQHSREKPVPPSLVDPTLPPQADAVVLKAMAKSPRDRYQSAAEMNLDLQRLRR